MTTFKKHLITIICISIISTASALPEMLDSFNLKYNTAKTKLDSCELCHMPYISDISSVQPCGYCHTSQTSENIRYLNPYGRDLEKHLDVTMDRALTEIENLDSDNDGISNVVKIRGRFFPGDSRDRPAYTVDNLTPANQIPANVTPAK